MVNKELEILACKRFVCPSLTLIDQKGKELGLRDSTIRRAKDMAIEYFKMTYHRPRYSAAKYLLPSFVYITSVLEGEGKFQEDVAKVFRASNVTINKWNQDIIDTLDINMSRDDMGIPDTPREIRFVCPNLCLIDKIGKDLGLRDSTIRRAKELAFRYFKATCLNPHYLHIEYVFSAVIYIAADIEGEKKTQLEISIVSGVPEVNISRFNKDVTKVLGLKMIRGCDGRVISY